MSTSSLPTAQLLKLLQDLGALTPEKPIRMLLEPRIVFDGAGVALAADMVAHAAEPAHAPAADSAAQTGDHAALVEALQSTAPAAAKPNIVFIDSAVRDPQVIAGAAQAGSEIVMIDHNSDGLHQIAQYLAGRSGIGAIHIVSHGDTGTLELGSTAVTQSTLATHAGDLAVIKAALAQDADILLYGCDVAANSAGQAFIATLAADTGADIAASTNTTGAAKFGGDWVLESHTGLIEARTIDAHDWDGLLAPLIISTTAAPTVTGATGTDPITGLAAGGVGYTAVWTSAGSIAGSPIDIRATVTSLSASTVSFLTQGDDPSIVLNGGAIATIKWEIFASGTSQTVLAVGSPHFQIADIDGIGGLANSRETVRPQLNGLTAFTLDNPTNLVASTSLTGVQVSGTQNQNGEATSLVAFDWSNVSSWSVEYTLNPASGFANAVFRHDGDGDFTFVAPNTATLLTIDLDGNNSTATGTAYQAIFTENGAGIAVVDADVTISQHVVLGTNLGQAHVVLTNAQTGDVLTVGTLPSGIAATVDTSVSGQITITLSGTDTIANYQTALAAIRFSNTSDAPSTADRNIIIDVRNTNFSTTSAAAISTIHVTAVNDAPVATATTAIGLEDAASIGLALAGTDVDGTVAKVTVTTLPTAAQGVLYLADGTTPVVAGTAITAAQAAGLKFIPTANFNGTVTIPFTVIDNNGLASASANAVISVMSVNDAPSGTDGSAAINDNATKTFSAADFGFADPNDTPANGLASVIITTLPTSGTLKLSGVAVSAGDEILAESLGNLVYVPAPGGGSESFTFKVRDNGGTTNGGANLDLSANTYTINVSDVTPPVAPVATTTANPNGTLTTSGAGEPGSTVTVTFPDGSTGTAIVAASGNFSVTSATPQTSGNVFTSQKDVANNISPAVTDVYTDTTAPLAPVATSVANPNGTLTTSGTGEPGSTVTVTFPDGSTGTQLVPASGNFSVTSATPQTSGNVVTTQKDAAGLVSPADTDVYADATAPLAPVATSVANPNGTLTTSGTGESGSTVTVTFPNGSTGTTLVQPDGTFSITSAMPQTSGNVVTTQKDPAGNVSPADSDPYVDTNPPLAPVVAAVQNPNSTLTTTGSGEPGATITVTYPDGTTGTTLVMPDGTFTLTSPSPQASGSITATQQDLAGNISPVVTLTFVDRSQTANLFNAPENVLASSMIKANIQSTSGDENRYPMAISGAILSESKRITTLWQEDENRRLTSGLAYSDGTMASASLRYSTNDSALQNGTDVIIRTEAFLNHGLLTFVLEQQNTSGTTHVVDYSVTQADGRALPQWLERPSNDMLQGRWSPNMEALDLRVRATLSDGRVINQDMRINFKTGEVKTLAQKRADHVPMFNEQVRKFAYFDDTSANILSDALAEAGYSPN